MLGATNRFLIVLLFFFFNSTLSFHSVLGNSLSNLKQVLRVSLHTLQLACLDHLLLAISYFGCLCCFGCRSRNPLLLTFRKSGSLLPPEASWSSWCADCISKRTEALRITDTFGKSVWKCFRYNFQSVKETLQVCTWLTLQMTWKIPVWTTPYLPLLQSWSGDVSSWLKEQL